MIELTSLIIAFISYVLVIAYSVYSIKKSKRQKVKDIDNAEKDGRKVIATKIKTKRGYRKIRNTNNPAIDFEEYDISTYEYVVNGEKFNFKKIYEYGKSPFQIPVYYRKNNPGRRIEYKDSFSSKQGCFIYTIPILVGGLTYIILKIIFK